MLKDLLRLPFFDAEGGAGGTSDGSKNTGGSDENKNTGKGSEDGKITSEQEQALIQKGIGIATAKLKKQLDEQAPLLKELDDLKKKEVIKLKDEEVKELESKKEYETILTQVREAHETEIVKERDVNSSLEGDIKKLVVDSELYKIAPELGVIKTAIGDFVDIFSKEIKFEKVTQDDGKFVYKTYPVMNGMQAINPKTGESLTVKEFAKPWLEKRNHYLEAKARSGSGSQSNLSGINNSSPALNTQDAIRQGLEDRKQYK